MDKELVTRLLNLGLRPDAVNEARALVKPRHFELSLSYQPILYAMLRSLPATHAGVVGKDFSPVLTLRSPVVETGCGTGLSTYYIIAALAAAGQGHLYSCDPLFKARGYALEKFRISAISGVRPTHEGVLADPERWTFLSGGSPKALELAAEAAPKWCCFVHDSAPNLFEAELAIAAKHLEENAIVVVAGKAAARKDLPEVFGKVGLLIDDLFEDDDQRFVIAAVKHGRPATVAEDIVPDGAEIDALTTPPPFVPSDELPATPRAIVTQLLPPNPNRVAILIPSLAVPPPVVPSFGEVLPGEDAPLDQFDTPPGDPVPEDDGEGDDDADDDIEDDDQDDGDGDE